MHLLNMNMRETCMVSRNLLNLRVNQSTNYIQTKQNGIEVKLISHCSERWTDFHIHKHPQIKLKNITQI